MRQSIATIRSSEPIFKNKTGQETEPLGVQTVLNKTVQIVAIVSSVGKKVTGLLVA